jgi:hypothetical protein
VDEDCNSDFYGNCHHLKIISKQRPFFLPGVLSVLLPLSSKPLSISQHIKNQKKGAKKKRKTLDKQCVI